jgi:hypothetical protein
MGPAIILRCVIGAAFINDVDLKKLEASISMLDERLRPIAQRPVDITRAGWVQDLIQKPHAFDDLNIRPEAEATLAGVLDTYAGADATQRETIRALFARCKAFSWAAHLRSSPQTAADFRRHLLLFSVQDLGTDTRDAIVTLDHLCAQARKAGLDVAPALREVAELSSDANRHRMGSAKSLLLDRAKRFGG